MKSENKELEDFFRQMKERDSQLDIPSPSEHVTLHKTRRWIPLAVAASVALLLTVYFIYPDDQKEEAYSIEIVLTEQPTTATQSLGEQVYSFDTWESPTQSLIDDF